MSLLVSVESLHVYDLVVDVLGFFNLFLELIFARYLQVTDIFHIRHTVNDFLEPLLVQSLGLIKVGSAASC